ncbi:hypothetical protein OS493_021761 [Desmophyllum pertusum]|uniref:Myb-like domain-containing protein n=1 Tax=Desmophyllum pertusum TaxID=174260 RepID=A0A9X0D8M7_9CNID|nr:hypothetical protein OS493_021761 [Desmophyllum pertusum]
MAIEATASSISNQKTTKPRKVYETWSKAEQEILVQLWAEHHEWLESREARTAWRKICDELNSRMESSKTVDKCMKKMKILIEKYKEAKEWNRKQSGGSKRKSILFDEIDAILGCRDIVTLSNVSEAGTSASSSPSNTSSSSSSAGSPVGSDDVDEQSNKKKSVGELTKKKDARNERKKSRKRNRADFEERDEEERNEFRESMDAFKKCGDNLSNFMETFSETPKQQMGMMGQFIGAMTQFMNKNTASSSPN